MEKMLKITFVLILVVALVTGLDLTAKAAYPEKPINLIVAFKAGGSVDTTFRVFSKALSKELGKPVVVSNRAGAGGAVGASNLKMKKSDGYTLGANISLPFTLSTNLGKVDFTVEDFTYIASLAKSQPAFVTTTEKGWKTWKDLIDAAKAKGSLSYASQSPWDKIATKIINKKSGVKLVGVPTKGGGEMVPKLLGGHVDFAYSGGVHYKYVIAGKMVVLAACTSDPLLAFPEVPTLKDLGYGISQDIPIMLVGPKGLSPELTKTLEKAARKAFENPDVQELITKRFNFPAVFTGSEQLTKSIKADFEAYKKALGN